MNDTKSNLANIGSAKPPTSITAVLPSVRPPASRDRTVSSFCIFWKRSSWTRDSIMSITAEAVLGLPYAIWFADEDAKKEE
jgi:hypothetical protein